MPATLSGNAADVLENVPSVSVDVDGNVSLRGSSSFTVLIDGRPSVMDAQDALQQIPASSIETIEIITNPSAKYDPEGNAGIINIKLKKEKNLGLGGVINANAGLNNKYGGDFIFEYKRPSYSYNFGMNYNHRFRPGNVLDEKRFDLESGSSYLNSSGTHERSRTSFGVKGGVDLNLSESDLLSIGGRYGTRDGKRNSLRNYLQWTNTDPRQSSYLSNSENERSGHYYALNINYNHKFPLVGHSISGEFFISHNSSDESSFSYETESGIQTSGKKTTETGPRTHFRGKIDYVLPIDENTKFEAGSQGESRLSEDANGIFDYNPQTAGYDFLDEYSHDTKYNRSQFAAYSILQKDWDKFGIQVGARTEYTYRTIDLVDTNQIFNIDRWDFFPSVHGSYKFGGGSQLMASYTKRIDRPHGWNLEPFISWMDPNNVRKGNPALSPEFIDSYEAGFQTFIGEVNISNDFYYKVNHDKIERIRSAYAEDVTMNTYENVGTDYSLGMEFMITGDPADFWKVDLMGNLYNYKIEGALSGTSFARESFNWNARINNGFTLSPSTQLQLNVRYNSPSVSSQGRWEGYFRTDAALKQDLFGKKLSLVLQVRDLFSTSKYEFTSEGYDFYSYTHYTPESPRVMLNIKFNFNNYKDDNDSGSSGGQQDDGMGGGGEI